MKNKHIVARMKEKHCVCVFWEGLNEGLGSIQNNPKTHWAYGNFKRVNFNRAKVMW